MHVIWVPLYSFDLYVHASTTQFHGHINWVLHPIFMLVWTEKYQSEKSTSVCTKHNIFLSWILILMKVLIPLLSHVDFADRAFLLLYLFSCNSNQRKPNQKGQIPQKVCNRKGKHFYTLPGICLLNQDLIAK